MFGVFAWVEDCHEGGASDFVKSFPTECEAFDFVKKLMSPIVKEKHIFVWEWQIVQLDTMKIIMDSIDFYQYLEERSND